MKVVDQAVREIKREVNIKVLKVPEIEQKVLDATSNEPWGPHGTVLGEIAQATKKFTECQLIMNALWTRLADSGCNWRHVYKDVLAESHLSVKSLSGFEYVEPNGKDVGMNVRKKVETILTLLNNKDKIQEVRNKAAANRDKYIGLSSSGMSYKPSSTSYGSSSFYHDDHHGGFGGTKDSEMHKSRDRDDDDADWNHAKQESYSRDGHDRSRLRSNLGHQDEGTISKKESTYSARRKRLAQYCTCLAYYNAIRMVGRHEDSYGPIPSTQSSSSLQKNAENDFDDDFDPRGSSTTAFAFFPSIWYLWLTFICAGGRFRDLNLGEEEDLREKVNDDERSSYYFEVFSITEKAKCTFVLEHFTGADNKLIDTLNRVVTILHTVDVNVIGSAAGRPNQVDLFGESLIGDLIDAPVPITNATTNGNTSTEVDLFADAAFVSASPNMEAHGGSHTEPHRHTMLILNHLHRDSLKKEK
ncbi:hypothetical protein ACLOJK_019869 [Asimina triloba]